jgi:hypothetical protein
VVLLCAAGFPQTVLSSIVHSTKAKVIASVTSATCLILHGVTLLLLFCLQRNYRTFLMFIYSTSIYIAWTFGVSLGSLFVKHKELAAAMEPAAQDSISSNLWLQTLGAC